MNQLAALALFRKKGQLGKWRGECRIDWRPPCHGALAPLQPLQPRNPSPR